MVETNDSPKVIDHKSDDSRKITDRKSDDSQKVIDGKSNDSPKVSDRKSDDLTGRETDRDLITQRSELRESIFKKESSIERKKTLDI